MNHRNGFSFYKTKVLLLKAKVLNQACFKISQEAVLYGQQQADGASEGEKKNEDADFKDKDEHQFFHGFPSQVAQVF